MAAQNTFVWTGLDKNGRKNQGEIVAASQALAKAQLRKQGISAKTVKRKSKPLFSIGSKKIKSSDIAIFTRQLATMMKAGVPLVQSFDIVAEGLDNEGMRELVTEIKTDVAAGGGRGADSEGWKRRSARTIAHEVVRAGVFLVALLQALSLWPTALSMVQNQRFLLGDQINPNSGINDPWGLALNAAETRLYVAEEGNSNQLAVVVLATHDLAQARRMADRRLLLAAGRSVEEGSEMAALMLGETQG